MELIIKGRNTEIPDVARDYIEKKIGKLDHYLEHLVQTEVEVAEEKTKSQGDRFVVQVTAIADGTILRAEERDADMRAAVDAVSHSIIQQIKRFKGKSSRRGRSGLAIRDIEQDTPDPADEDQDETEAGILMRVKRFPIKPMYPEEATEQMELLGHSFFLFFNASTDRYSVVYRRGDGQYGMIEPERP
ncbi:MAG: ribosome-associated translation inhibitor RaiA [Dehalococcoidia bacterium]|nr:ribosome-associated translation inhibitor RaiA [Dehalococcoidia bacterium]